MPQSMLKIKYFIVILGLQSLFTEGKTQSADTLMLAPPDEAVREYVTNNELLLIDSVVPVQERKIDEATIQKLKEDKAYWYASKALVNQKPGQQTTRKNWADILFWVLLGGLFITVMIWFLSSSNVRLFRKRSRSIEAEASSTETENIYGLDFEKEIHKAEAAGDYCLGIRLHYLQMLRTLADQDIIQYAQDKTNSDYLSQLAGTSYYKNFFRLTRHFDYVWYGKFPLTEAGYSKMKGDFRAFRKQLPS